MEITDAQKMIQLAFNKMSEPQEWTDLGCGRGTFTYALANLLPDRSKIHAIDSKPQKLKNTTNVEIQFIQADFQNDELDLPKLDGILMANSIHYVGEKSLLLDKLIGLLKEDGQFVIVEYDTSNANTWVPYPINFISLLELFKTKGFKAEKIGERRSIYGRANIYASHLYKT